MFSPKQQSATDFRTSCASNNCFPGKSVSPRIRKEWLEFILLDQNPQHLHLHLQLSLHLRSRRWEYHPNWGQGNESTILFDVKEIKVPSYSRSRKWEYRPIWGQGKGGTESIVPIGVTRLGGPDSRASLWQNWSVSEGNDKDRNVVFDRKANKPWL